MQYQEKLDRDALFTDETAQFRFPLEVEAGDEVTFRFRTLKDNVSEVMLCSRALQRSMEKAFTKGLFDYYETRLVVGNEPFEYCFFVTNDEEYVYYDKMGVSLEESLANRSRRLFTVIPGFASPDWAKGAVMYQILVDRFRNGDPENDVLSGEYSYIKEPVERVEDWFSLPHDPDVRRFYGGDLVGVMEKLDYLKYLGIEAIYFNPLFVSPSNHKYDIQDYDHIDPHLTGFVEDGGALLPEGSLDNRQAERYLKRVTDKKNLEYANAYFARFIKEAHKRGIKVIMDGVFNHCGASNKWMDRDGIYRGQKGFQAGAYLNPDSPYHDYFIFDIPGNRGGNRRYTGWWGHETLPKLYYENSRELQKEILRIARKWVSEPFNADGWRLDVAADLGLSDRFNHRFWKEFRAAVKEENPDAVIIAEHYGDPGDWLRGAEWDTVMNYDAFMEPVGYFLTGMEKHSDEQLAWLEGDGWYFFRTLRDKMSQLPVQSLYTAMNELSNHDHARFLTRTNRRIGRLKTVGSYAAGEGISYSSFRQGVVIQFTLPGAPTVYYGDETGVVGWTDPDSRRTYPWGREDWSMISFHREMIRIHKKYSALKAGAFKPLCMDRGFIAYGRFDENSAVTVAINHWDHERYVEIPVWLTGVPEGEEIFRIMQTTDQGYNVGVKAFSTEDGLLKVTLPPRSSAVFAKDKISGIRVITKKTEQEY
ncbi:MAG: glycoside hydrolase family 13 protein [Lachnospiraceae bacterium]|nr:glycoside hydrolase family 13 protein [Lachnospiraceae bacterium]